MASEKKSTRASSGSQSRKSPTESLISTQAAIPGAENDYGAIRISESVFAALVRKYTLEVDGVVRFASGSLMGGLAEMIGRRSSESSILVKFEGDAVNIAVTLVIRYGAKIPEVSELVQSVIRQRIEDFTGKHVAKVDVIIQDIDDEEEADEEADKEGESRLERKKIESAKSSAKQQGPVPVTKQN